jgi:hypothetical protein
MHTIIDKHRKKPWEHVINNDGMVWTAEYPKNTEGLHKKKYQAMIPDRRLDHFDFDSFGWHKAWADTIEELLEDIRSFEVPYYSEDDFLDKLVQSDKEDERQDMQVELYFDGCGTKVTRGEYNINNMTAYTSL